MVLFDLLLLLSWLLSWPHLCVELSNPIELSQAIISGWASVTT